MPGRLARFWLLITLSPVLVLAQMPDCVTYSDLPQPLTHTELNPAGAVAAAPLGDDYLVVILDGELQVLDITDPLLMHPVGSLAGAFDHWHTDLAVVGHHAYVVMGEISGIIDLADPTAPILVGDLPQFASNVEPAGDLLIVSDHETTSLCSLDDPAAPATIGVIPHPGDPTLLDDSLLALLTNGIRIYDIADPTAPTVVYSEINPVVEEPFLYATTYVNGARLSGSELLMTENSYQRTGSWIYGNVEFFSAYGRRLVDIGDPENPVTLQSVQVASSTENPAYVDQTLADFGTGLSDGRMLFDPASGSLATVAWLPTGQPVNDGVFPTATGHVVVVSAQRASTLDADELMIPNRAAVDFGYVQSGRYVAAAAGSAFLARLRYEENEIHNRRYFVDLFTAPGEPFAADIYADDDATDVWLQRRNVFVRSFGTLFHYYVSPDGSTIDGGLSYRSVTRLAVRPDHHVALLDGTALTIFDLADAQAPIVESTIAITGIGTIAHLAWEGAFMLACGETGVACFDVSDLSAPILRGTLLTADARWSAISADGIAIVRNGPELLRVRLTGAGAPEVLMNAPRGEVDDVILIDGPLGYSLDGDLVSVLDLETLVAIGTLVVAPEPAALGFSQGQLVGVGRFDGGWGEIPLPCEAVTAVVETGPSSRTGGFLAAGPNPFNPRVTVAYDVGRDALVKLTVHDARGRAVRHLVSERQPAGRHQVTWDGRDDHGRGLAGGVYLLVYRSADDHRATKVTLVK